MRTSRASRKLRAWRAKGELRESPPRDSEDSLRDEHTRELSTELTMATGKPKRCHGRIRVKAQPHEHLDQEALRLSATSSMRPVRLEAPCFASNDHRAAAGCGTALAAKRTHLRNTRSPTLGSQP